MNRVKKILGGTITFLVICLVLIKWGLPIYLEKKLTNLLQSQMGTKVLIEETSLNFFPFGLKLTSLTIGDDSKEFYNKLSVSEMALEVAVWKILTKKEIVIPKLQVTGVAFNTPRETSGWIKKEAATPIEKASETMTGASESGLGKAVKVEKQSVDQSQLTVMSESEKINQELLSSKAEFDSLLSIDTESKGLDQLKTRLLEIKQSDMSSLDSINEGIRQLMEVSKESVVLRESVQIKQKKIEGVMKTYQLKIDQLDQFAENDYKRLSRQLSKGSKGNNSISSTLLSKYFHSAINSILRLTNQVESVADSGKETNSKIPKFLIQQVVGSGIYEGHSFVLAVKNLTNMPKKMEAPMHLHITHHEGAKSQFVLDLLLTYQNPRFKHSLTITARQIELKELTLYQSKNKHLYLKNAFLEGALDIVIIDNSIRGHIQLALSDASYQKENIHLKSSMPYLLYQTLKQVHNPAIAVLIKGNLSSPSLSVSSPVDKQFAGIVNMVVKKQLDRRKVELLAIVNQSRDQSKQTLTQQFPSKASLEKLQILDKKLSDMNLNISQMVSGYRQHLDKIKSSTLDKVEDKVEDAIKSFF